MASSAAHSLITEQSIHICTWRCSVPNEQAIQELQARVREVIERLTTDKTVDLGNIQNDTLLFLVREESPPIFDSFEAVMILIELENVFGFQIRDEDMVIERFNTIDLMADYIEQHR